MPPGRHRRGRRSSQSLCVCRDRSRPFRSGGRGGQRSRPRPRSRLGCSAGPATGGPVGSTCPGWPEAPIGLPAGRRHDLPSPARSRPASTSAGSCAGTISPSGRQPVRRRSSLNTRGSGRRTAELPVEQSPLGRRLQHRPAFADTGNAHVPKSTRIVDTEQSARQPQPGEPAIAFAVDCVHRQTSQVRQQLLNKITRARPIPLPSRGFRRQHGKHRDHEDCARAEFHDGTTPHLGELRDG